MRELAAALDRFDDAASRELGAGRSDLRALDLLEDGPLTAGALASRLGLSSGSVTALVDRLVAARDVERNPDPSDRRRVVVGLRPATWQAFARVDGPCGRTVAEVGDALPPRRLSSAA